MNETILVIDDDPAVLESCQAIFKAEGYDVTVTINPEEGLNLATQKDFKVILCDWKMPGFDGLDVVAELENRAPQSTVVMFSGYPSVERACEAMNRGAMDFLPKPFTPEEITETVRKAMGRKVSREANVMRRFEGILSKFPTPSTDDKAPKNIAETVAQTVGVAKANSPWITLFVLGMMAGTYIGFGGMFATSVTFDIGPIVGIGIKKLIAGATFSLGLMLVVIAGAELFTGNNLMISSVMTGKITWKTMLAKWGIVYFANLVGSVLLAVMFATSGLWRTASGDLGVAAVNIAYAKVTLPWIEAFVRAIGCNWLVCLAVWMALASRNVIGKIFAIFFPIMGFVAIGFEHCVANMYFIPTGIFLNQWFSVMPSGGEAAALTWIGFWFANLVPVTLGNIIGGAVFVGLGYWGAYLRPSPARA